MKTARYALLLMSLVLVAACGTKGPLVMPDKAGPGEESSEPSSEPADPVEPQAPPEPPAAP